jgi:putative FmdB family regulatory protein
MRPPERKLGDVPVFEYRCAACAAELEEIVLPGESPPLTCPACGGELVRRWSRVGVQLVGWGFARNDAMLRDDGKRRSFRQVKDKAAELFD